MGRQPVVEWAEPLRPIGPDDCPWGRLLGTLSIGGILHHVEAIAVIDRNGEQSGVLDADQTSIDLAFELSDGQMQTVEIEGREYVIVVHPYQR